VRECHYGASAKKAAFVGGLMLALLPSAALAQGQSQSGGFVNPFAWLFQASAPQCIPDVPNPSIYTRCTLQTARGREVCRCDLAYDTDPKDRQASVSAGSIGTISSPTPTAPTTPSVPTTTPTSEPITTVSITPDDPITTSGKLKGNNGIGNGVDPQPPGNPPVNDGPGEQPGNN
jgi:hypothetical protein